MTPSQNKWKYFPLKLTIARLLVGPLFFLGYVFYAKMGLTVKIMPLVLIALVTLSEVSDFFDGYIARKYKVVTNLGKVLDPMCDSVTRLVIFLTFTLPPVNLPIWLVFIFVYRDGIIGTLRTVCALKGVALAARQSGKVKAILQAVSVYIILALLALHTWGLVPLLIIQLVAFYTVVCTAIITVISAIEYLKAGSKHIVQASRIASK